MHHAQMLLWIDDGWSADQRRRYFELIADAIKHSKGGHQYIEFWSRIRGIALDRMPEDQRERFESIPAATAPGLADALPTPTGPGRDWSLEAALESVRQGLEGRDLANGRTMYSAAGCVVCHRFNGEGGAIGPDLSSIGQRFTVRDILDATLNPSRAISDQYQVTTLELVNGSTLSGRIVSRGTTTTRIAPNLMKPTESIELNNASIRRERREPVSTMPSGLVNSLNEDELLDLLAYLVSSERLPSVEAPSRP
jgi:putative heme-binding domain-containing protein